MKYGLLGKKLSHSFSKELHSRFGTYDYEMFEIEEKDLDDFFSRDDLAAINVTIPYKEKVIKYCDEVSPVAKRIGAINTITFSDKIRGYNTDYLGLKYVIESNKIDINNKDVFILGDGGTSKTARVLLEDLNAKSITNVTRGKSEVNYENIYKYSPQIIVNTTPVGMYPNNGESLIDLEKIPSLEAIIDVVYNPLMTKLIFDGKNLGLKTGQGLPMLIEQGRRASEIFTGLKISEEKKLKVENKIRRYNSNLILVGMPGVGKSEFAYELGKRMNREYIDIDNIIKKKYGEPKKIITEKGEDFFRDIESKVVREVGKLNHKVIATGGGLLVKEENYYHLKQNGRIYLLKRDLDKLSTRGRPLSKGKGSLLTLYEKRKDLYERFSDKDIYNMGRIDLSVLNILEDFYEN